jgi:hypothetical protein
MPLPPHDPFTVVAAEPGETVFRLLEGPEATVDDFLTDEQTEKVDTLAATGSMAIYRGISVRRTLPQARRLARLLRRDYIAEVTLTWREGDALARTFRTSGHHTLWAHPEQVWRRVVQVHPARE